ncbi:MAG: hypothetical protein KAQ85_01695 [Thermodesulfovibrionia bacterium]|nr:hypothetical protein [Thermodesulfovibrionia bacterium]
MPIMGKDCKLFIGDYQISNDLMINSFSMSASVDGLVEGTITFFVEEANINKDGDIVLGKSDEKAVKKYNRENPGNLTMDRSLII